MTATIANTTTPLPDVTDRELAGYWEGCSHNELRVQKCGKCGTFRWPPRSACAECQSFDAAWTPVAQEGELFTWTVVGQTPQEGFSALTPYAVAVVQLDGVPVRMLGYVDEDPKTLVAGERLHTKFVRKSDQVNLPVWVRAGKDKAGA